MRCTVFALLAFAVVPRAIAGNPPGPPAGEWVSPAYGYHLSATASGYRVFDVLGDGCTRRADDTPLFTVFQPTDDDGLHAYATHEPYAYAFRRAPAPCRVIEGDDPALNMAAVKRFFRQHYAFDAERHAAEQPRFDCRHCQTNRDFQRRALGSRLYLTQSFVCNPTELTPATLCMRCIQFFVCGNVWL